MLFLGYSQLVDKTFHQTSRWDGGYGKQTYIQRYSHILISVSCYKILLFIHILYISYHIYYILCIRSLEHLMFNTGKACRFHVIMLKFPSSKKREHLNRTTLRLVISTETDFPRELRCIFPVLLCKQQSSLPWNPIICKTTSQNIPC